MSNDLRLSQVHAVVDAFVELYDSLEDYFTAPVNINYINRLVKARAEAKKLIHKIEQEVENAK